MVNTQGSTTLKKPIEFSLKPVSATNEELDFEAADPATIVSLREITNLNSTLY